MLGQKKRIKNYNRYSVGLKRKIAKSYLSGEASYAILAEENGLRDKTVVKEFVKWYRRKLELEPDFDERFEIKETTNILSEKELKARVKELEKKIEEGGAKNRVVGNDDRYSGSRIQFGD